MNFKITMHNNNRLIILLSAIVLLFAVNTSCNRQTDSKNISQVNDTTADELSKLNKAISLNPKDIKLYLERARYYSRNNNYNEALGDVNAAMTINSKDPDVYITLSEVYLYSGKTQRSLDALKKAKELAPGNADVDVSIARVYLTMSDYKQTFNALREAIRKNPENPEAFFLSGLANEEIGDTLKAIDSYQNAVARNSKHYDALKQLGILFSIRKSPLAIDYLRNASQVRKNAPEPLYVLGMYYQENNEPDKALSVYQEIIQIDSAFKLAHYNTGYVYLVYKKEFDNAIEAFSKAIKIDPDYSEAVYNRGFANELAGKYESAKSDYQQVLRMKVNDDKAIQGLNRIDALEK